MRSWKPQVWDYLYVSLTNSIAFSPTDTLPMSLRAKGLMGLESFIAAATILLVAARAVNVLGRDRRSRISLQELQLAARNHGILLEALRWEITPVGSTTSSRTSTSPRSTRRRGVSRSAA